MSKKIVVFVIIIFSFLSVLIIALIGTLPDNVSVNLEEIIISPESYDGYKYENNEDGTVTSIKIKDLKDIVTDNNLSFDLYYELTLPAAFEAGLREKYPDEEEYLKERSRILSILREDIDVVSDLNFRVDYNSNRITLIFDLSDLKKTFDVKIVSKKNQGISDHVLLYFTKDGESGIE
jgi:hypothetical protein